MIINSLLHNISPYTIHCHPMLVLLTFMIKIDMSVFRASNPVTKIVFSYLWVADLYFKYAHLKVVQFFGLVLFCCVLCVSACVARVFPFVVWYACVCMWAHICRVFTCVSLSCVCMCDLCVCVCVVCGLVLVGVCVCGLACCGWFFCPVCLLYVL